MWTLSTKFVGIVVKAFCAFKYDRTNVIIFWDIENKISVSDICLPENTTHDFFYLAVSIKSDGEMVPFKMVDVQTPWLSLDR